MEKIFTMIDPAPGNTLGTIDPNVPEWQATVDAVRGARDPYTELGRLGAGLAGVAYANDDGVMNIELFADAVVPPLRAGERNAFLNGYQTTYITMSGATR